MEDIAAGKRGNHLQHADLWNQIETAVGARDPGYFLCRWVPAHTVDADAGQLIDHEDREMNKGADALAVQAALVYAPPERLVIGAKTRRKQALAIQATAIAILEVRALVKPLHGSCSDEHNDLLECDSDILAYNSPITSADLDLLQEQLEAEDCEAADCRTQVLAASAEQDDPPEDWDDPFGFGFGLDE